MRCPRRRHARRQQAPASCCGRDTSNEKIGFHAEAERLCAAVARASIAVASTALSISKQLPVWWLESRQLESATTTTAPPLGLPAAPPPACTRRKANEALSAFKQLAVLAIPIRCQTNPASTPPPGAHLAASSPARQTRLLWAPRCWQWALGAANCPQACARRPSRGGSAGHPNERARVHIPPPIPPHKTPPPLPTYASARAPVSDASKPARCRVVTVPRHDSRLAPS
eukprot:366213-Chlamydomonas_euryale.AAC.1